MIAPSSEPNLSTLIRAALERSAAEPEVVLEDGQRAISLDALGGRHWIEAAPEALAGRNILLLTQRPLNAALALCGLDGLVNRLVVCPPDLAERHLPLVIADAEVDAIVHDRDDDAPFGGLPAYRISAVALGEGPRPPRAGLASQWALFTSGTTGAPKMVIHDLAGLTHAIPLGAPSQDGRVVWATFYDIRRYGGLQMLLRALTGGRSMMLTSPGEMMTAFLNRLEATGATHVSGTPSHWRGALMHSAISRLRPDYVRLSGEIADQGLLDRLAATFPRAAVGHAYASTEAGVGFEVVDGREGFPAAYLDRVGPVEMRLRDGTLRIRSPGAARRYLGGDEPALADADGFVDTGDLVERRGDRLHFMGRASGVINVGGLKAHPEEIEAVINRCRGVRMSLVQGRRNPITGAIITARVVLNDIEQGAGEIGAATRADILAACRSELTAFKVPAMIEFVETLPMTPGGKLERRHA